MSGLKASNGVPQKPGGKSRLPRTSSSSSKAMSSKPGDREVTKMNLMAVRKSDSYATEIISTVPQVVVYKYEGANNTWERTSVEGTLFIYSRKAGPGHAFVVLNRLNSGNTQEMVSAGMTFRVQQPFILFKKHSGDIFGLCIQDEKVCEETGQLLSRLAAGLSNGYSGQEGGSSIAAGRRTKSTPVFKRDDNVKLDVNEYLESSGMNYLGQTFSDDTSSQDSLNSEPITFTPKPPKPSSTSSSSSSQGQTKPARSGSRSPVKARTKGAAKNSTPKSFSSSSSSKPASTAQRKSVGLVEVTAHSPTFNKRSSQQQQQPSESRHKRENFQHASSFDSAGGGVKGGSKENGGSLPGSRSSSPLETGKPPQKKAVSSSLNVTSGSPLTVSAIPPSSLSDHSDNIVRKLFSSEPSSSEHTAVVSLHQISSSISSGPHPVSSTSSALASGSPLPLQAISLDEVEKQMKEEAPSPDIAAPFSLFGSASAGVRSNEASLNLSSSLGGETVLLQPSVFSTAPPSNPTSSPHGLTTLASMPQGTGNNQLQQHFSTAQRQQHGHDTAPGLVSISVQPPTPLPLQHHQGLPASLSLQAQQQQQPSSSSSSSSHHVPPTTVASSFPPIPPLIHAPGMRAAPLTSPPTTHNETQQEERKENQQTLATSSHANNMPSNTPNLVSNRHYSPPPPSTTSATHQHTTCTFPSAVVVMKPGRTYSDPSVLSHYSAVGRNPAATSPPPPGRHYSLAGSSTAGIMLSPLSEISIPQAPVPNPAALMSPMQFASHQQGEGSGTSVAPELSREQMQQGLIYLIQNDATFMDTLHKAYQLSLSDQR